MKINKKYAWLLGIGIVLVLGLVALVIADSFIPHDSEEKKTVSTPVVSPVVQSQSPSAVDNSSLSTFSVTQGLVSNINIMIMVGIVIIIISMVFKVRL